MTNGRNRPDLLIVGGGVIGLATARDAAARGLRVTLLERGNCGREASWAAAGMLSPLGEALQPGPFLRFGLDSLEAYPAFVAELQEETGIGVELRKCGKLRLALSEGEEERLRARFHWARDRNLDVRWLESGELQAEEPALVAPARGGLLLEDDFRVDNRALARALVESLRLRGVSIREGEEVRGVAVRNGRARAVLLADGESLPASAVLLAAGAWTGTLEGLPFPVPVRPVRGQMLALHPAASPSRRVLESEEVYLVPRDDGRVLVGATEEEVGFRRETTAGGLADVLNAALRLVPGLRSASVDQTWAGLRPGSPDGLPILGAHPGVKDLYIATGHFRNGILLTPATAGAMGALVTGGPGPVPPPEFGPERFRTSAETAT